MSNASGSTLQDPAPNSAPDASLFFRRLLLLLVFVPMLVLGWLIYIYGVDTPYWDEWDEIPSGLLKLHDGTLSWSNLIAQHNEHRILFPRIILLATAWLTSWNVRAELLVSWLLACLCSFNLWRISRLTGSTNSNRDLALMAGANVLLFTPVAFENWLWGFQVGFLLPLAALTLAVWLVSASRPPLSFFYAIVLSFVCTFSVASGFLCWLITLPLLVYSGGRWLWWERMPGILCWFVSFIASMGLYFYGFVRSPDSPDLFLFLEEPGEATLYFLAYLGSPFGWCFGLEIIVLSSTLLLVLYTCALIYLWRFRTDARLIAQTLPWLMLTIFALVNGFLTMLGRLNFGYAQATGPRYIAFSILLPIGLLFLWARVYAHWRSRAVTTTQVQAMRFILGVCLIAGFGTNLLCACDMLDHWKGFQHSRLLSKVLVEFVRVTNEEELTNGAHLTYGNFEQLREDARRMGELGYLRPAPVADGRISALADVSDDGSAENGHFDDVVRMDNGQAYAYGWAVLPNKQRPADAVLLTYEEPNHPEGATIFSVIPVSLDRKDVAQAMGLDYEVTGWARRMTANLLPPGPHVLRAWAFDLEENRAYQLANAYKFELSSTPPPGVKSQEIK